MLDRFFEGHRQLFIRQRKEWTEIVIDWETRNQYEV
ncbi:MAG: scramblase, partial [Deltaproteobacteria bacterium]|nr:scramblase [Deltaproteobacteria bacterium]